MSFHGSCMYTGAFFDDASCKHAGGVALPCIREKDFCIHLATWQNYFACIWSQKEADVSKFAGRKIGRRLPGNMAKPFWHVYGKSAAECMATWQDHFACIWEIHGGMHGNMAKLFCTYMGNPRRKAWQHGKTILHVYGKSSADCPATWQNHSACISEIWGGMHGNMAKPFCMYMGNPWRNAWPYDKTFLLPAPRQFDFSDFQIFHRPQSEAI